MSTITIIDGDVLAYIACKSRLKVNPETGNFIIEHGYKDQVTFTEEEDKEYLDESWFNFKEHVKQVQDICFAEFSLIAVKGPDNYRDRIYTEYKQNRSRDYKSTIVDTVRAIRLRAIEEGLACEAIDREADDMLRIWSEQAKANEDDYIICSIDKDLNCIPGRHYHLKNNELYMVSEMEAIKLFYTQLLSGDPSDNVPGLPGIGPKKAAAALNDFNEEFEFQWVVSKMYKEKFADNWRDYLLSNGKMLYLQKHPTDYFTLEGWAIAED